MAHQKAYHRVAEHIREMIKLGEYKPMSRLPPERELASRFEVSRTTIREALLALEAAEIINIRDRSGAYVLETKTGQGRKLSALEISPGPYEVLQLRRLIEGEACFQVALNAPASAIREIVALKDANANVPPDDTPEFRDASRKFHLGIVQASENSLFVSLFEFLWAQKNGPLWDSWYRGTRSRDNRKILLQHNQEIADAIAARLPDAARTAIHHHLDWMITRFLKYKP